jgi:hypothetical protein
MHDRKYQMNNFEGQRMKLAAIFGIGVSLLLSGCAAMLVPASSDPDVKLNWAVELIDDQKRPLPAERLIREASEIYEERRDEAGLAKAYRVYGLFFKSYALVKWQKFYQKHGFMDKSATYATRIQKSVEYFNKSRALFEKQQNFYMVLNVQIQIAFAYQIAKDTNAACASFNESLITYKAILRKEPDAVVKFPSQYASFEDSIASFKMEAGCQ